MAADEDNGIAGNNENVNQAADQAGLEDDDLEAQMAATMTAEGITESQDEDDLEAQMAAAMDVDDTAEDLEEDDLEAQMSAAMDDNESGDVSESLVDELSEDGEKGIDSEVAVQPARFQQLRPSDEQGERDNIDRLMDVSLNLSVEIGRKRMEIREILNLGPGKIIELDKLAGEPVDLLVNGKLLARGEVVVVDENFGVRITELIDKASRIQSL